MYHMSRLSVQSSLHCIVSTQLRFVLEVKSEKLNSSPEKIQFSAFHDYIRYLIRLLVTMLYIFSLLELLHM